jgi:hypothetical protein
MSLAGMRSVLTDEVGDFIVRDADRLLDAGGGAGTVRAVELTAELGAALRVRAEDRTVEAGFELLDDLFDDGAALRVRGGIGIVSTSSSSSSSSSYSSSISSDSSCCCFL